MNNIQEKQDLIITYTFDAPVSQVWRAWVEPDLVKRWWGPHGFTAPLAEIDFREGGVSLVCMSAPQYGFPEQYSTWEYTEIVPHKRIDYIHNLADKDGKAIDPAAAGMPPDFPQGIRNLVEFKDLGGRTELTITEFDWPVGEMMEMSRQGLAQCMEKMAALFA